MSAQPLAEYTPQASRKTQVLLEQLTRGGARSQRPDSAVLEEVLAAGTQSAATDADGFYTMTNLPAGVYTLTASAPGCTIAPVQRTVTVPPDGVNHDFNAICLTERVVLPLIVR